MSTQKYSVNVITLLGSHQHVYRPIYLFIFSCLNESQIVVLDSKIKIKRIDKIKRSSLLQTSLPESYNYADLRFGFRGELGHTSI